MVLVTFYTQPGLHPQERTDQHPLGDEIRTRAAGQLEVLDRGRVIKAYAPGHWNDAWVAKD